MRTIEASVDLRVEPPKLWRGITDHEALPRHTGLLRTVRVVEPKVGGVGTIRECTLRSGRRFTERITVWDEGRRYCYSPDLSRAPFPFKRAEACWSIEARGTGSHLTYRLEYEPKSWLRDLLFYPMLKTLGVRQAKKMLRSYEDHHAHP